MSKKENREGKANSKKRSAFSYREEEAGKEIAEQFETSFQKEESPVFDFLGGKESLRESEENEQEQAEREYEREYPDSDTMQGEGDDLPEEDPSEDEYLVGSDYFDNSYDLDCYHELDY
jgi:hypothetical protein